MGRTASSHIFTLAYLTRVTHGLLNVKNIKVLFLKQKMHNNLLN